MLLCRTLDLGSGAQVSGLIIYNRFTSVDRMRDFQIRLGNTLPTATGGQLFTANTVCGNLPGLLPNATEGVQVN